MTIFFLPLQHIIMSWIVAGNGPSFHKIQSFTVWTQILYLRPGLIFLRGYYLPLGSVLSSWTSKWTQSILARNTWPISQTRMFLREEVTIARVYLSSRLEELRSILELKRILMQIWWQLRWTPQQELERMSSIGAGRTQCYEVQVNISTIHVKMSAFFSTQIMHSFKFLV